MKLQQALARYVTQLRANGRSEHTVLQAQRHVRLLARWLDHERRATELDAINEHTLAEFLTSDTACRSARGGTKTPGSMNALRGSMTAFFGHAAQADWLERDPARLIKRAICTPGPPRALREHEQRKLLAVLGTAKGITDRRDFVLVEFLLGTGARLSSALALRIEDLDLEEGVAHLRSVKRGGEQLLFLPDRVRDLLATHVGDRRGGAVFCGRDGAHLSARHFQRRLRLWRERAGISRQITAHSCRHAFATRLYERTHDILTVQAALGHASLSSTIVYARADQRVVRSAVLAG